MTSVWQRMRMQRQARFELLGSHNLVAIFAFSAVGILMSLYVAVYVALRKLILAARQVIAHWQRRVRIRNELITLSDGDLRDIGWTRAEVEAKHRKPFWRA